MTKLPEDFLASWAEEASLISDGKVNQHKLLAGAIAAQDAGLDLNRREVRQSLVDEASDPDPRYDYITIREIA